MRDPLLKLDSASKTSPSLQAEYDERMSQMLDEHFATMAPVIKAINEGMAATTPTALADRADALRRERELEAKAVEVLRKNAFPSGYPNPKVDALLTGTISLSPGTFTERDFLDLALAVLDQAGVSISLQRRVNELVADEMEDAQLHVQPCGFAACYACELNGFGADAAACYGCELNARAKEGK